MKKKDQLLNALYDPSRDYFRSEIGHMVKNMGDIEFIKYILVHDPIHFCLKNGEKYRGLYLLAMIDYLSRENNLPLCPVSDKIRETKKCIK